MSHGTYSPNTDIVPSVCLTLDGLTGRLEVGVVGCLVSTKGIPVYVCPVSGSSCVQLLKAGAVTFTYTI